MRTNVACAAGLACALALLAGCGRGGGDGECRDASCVRDVTITRMETTWSEDGSSVTAPAWDADAIALDAFVTSATGQTNTLQAERDGSRWVIRDVPGGPYRLRMTSRYGVPLYLDTSSGDVDLGWDRDGRTDLAYPSAPTVATLRMSGLAPWSATDFLQLVSWNAGLSNRWRPAVDVGATSVDAAYDFAGTGWDGADPLLVPADRLDAVQLHPQSSASGAWAAAVARGSATGVSMADGSPTSVSVAMVPAALDRQVNLDWRATRFEKYLPAMGAGATAAEYPHWVYVIAAPVSAALSGYVGTPTHLLEASVPPGADAHLGTRYANVSPTAAYAERVVAVYGGEVQRAVPGAAPARFTVTIGREDPSVPSPIAPVVSPAAAVRVAGRDASLPQAGVGTAPALSWLAPALGHVDGYVVTVLELYADAGQTRTWTVMSLRTAATEVTLPPDVLTTGRPYVVVIDARAGSYGPDAPYRSGAPCGWARTVTETFTP